jgi:hypothetical protein
MDCRVWPAPMAWMYAECVAEDMVDDSGVALHRGQFEFRAVRDVLALTTFLLEREHAEQMLTRRLHLITDRLSPGGRWHDWCESHIVTWAGNGAADVDRALAAWRWLEHTPVYCLSSAPGRKQFCTLIPGEVQLPAWRHGMRGARRIVATANGCGPS